MEEFEIKFLEVDVTELERKLISIGAEKVGEYNYSRVLLDYPDFRMNERHALLRVRSDGTKTTLAYKERIGAKSQDGSVPDEGMREIETNVESYEKTCEILKSIGLVVKREEKNRRIRYEKGDAVFDIDFWPQIPPYVEIESTSLKAAQDAALELGFDPKDGLICTAKQVYRKYGYDIDDYISITPEKMVKK